MARIAGIELPRNKNIGIGLTYIYGIGRVTAAKILDEAGVDPATNADTLGDDEIATIRSVIDRGYRVEGDLRREVTTYIKHYIDIGAYRGLRHRRNLPVRGQRTKNNTRTRKGPRRTVAGKKSAPTPK